MPEVEVAERPTFDPDKPPPCDSHTACYLAAKEAHATGERAGYLLALERCEYYRGRYQLEKFYGLCLLILADSYRHLNNLDEAKACYRRFLDTGPEDSGLALQARAGIDEIEAGESRPALYRDYLRAVSLLTRYNRDPQFGHLEQAGAILRRIKAEQGAWPLAGNIEYLLDQIAKLGEGGGAPAPALVPLTPPSDTAPEVVEETDDPDPGI
jgi:tetratricopeptide (TPR) repeat protein